MNVYVETNFVLELSLAQEESTSCEEILRLCESGDVRLLMPAYSLVEPYEKLRRNDRQRKLIKSELDKVLIQLQRTALYTTRVDEFKALLPLLLVDSTEEEYRRLEHYRTRILDIAEIISLDSEILSSASSYQRQHDFSPQDAIVYASVVEHLDRHKPSHSCFINRNSKDFGDPDIIYALQQRNCKMLPKFTTGRDYVLSVVG